MIWQSERGWFKAGRYGQDKEQLELLKNRIRVLARHKEERMEVTDNLKPEPII